MRQGTRRWISGSLLLSIACGGSGGTSSPGAPVQPTVATVQVSPSPLDLIVGAQGALVATARDAQGNAVPSTAFTWSSQGSAIATVSSTGIVTALAPGTTTVTATAGSVSGAAVVNVRLPALALILTVSPGAASTTVGSSVPFTVVARDASGAVQPTPTITSWTSSAPAVATVSAGGVATGAAAGTTLIGASAGSIAAVPATLTVSALTLTVTPGNATTNVGGTVPFTVVATDANGVVRPTPAITAWTTTAAAIGTVSATGVATGVSAGTAMIGAMAGTVVATPATFTVSAAGCASLAARTTWDASMEWTWSRTGTNASNHRITARHSAKLTSVLVRVSADVDEVRWDGPPGGMATVDDEDVDLNSSPQAKTTVQGSGQVATAIKGDPVPGITLTLDPRTCVYRLETTPQLFMTRTMTGTAPQQAIVAVGAMHTAWTPVPPNTNQLVTTDQGMRVHSGPWFGFQLTPPDVYIPFGVAEGFFEGLAGPNEPLMGHALISWLVK